MLCRILGLILALLALGGCESSKSLMGNGSKKGPGRADIPPGGEVRDELDGLVLRENGGVRFRRDLPFPARLEVRMSQSLDYQNVKVVEVSDLGKSVKTLNHKVETEIWCGKGPGVFEFRLEKGSRRVAAAEEKDSSVIDVELNRAKELEGQSLNFALSEGGWRTRHGAGAVDFKRAVWSDSMEDSVPQLMVETGAHPRVQWFSASRMWRQGDGIMLTGNTLKILDPYDVSGRMALKFEGEEAVGGHPCGVFSLSGDMRVMGQIQADGSQHDVDISISSGKIWASLLYPVLLREEYETVQTMTQREGKRGGPETRLQGGVRVLKCRNWVPADE